MSPAHPLTWESSQRARRKILGLFAAASVLVAVAGPVAAQRAPASRLVPVLAGAPAAGAPQAPDFSLQANDGQTYSLEALKGNIVLLFFWATWCPYCRQAVPSMAELADKYSNASFTLIGISGDKDVNAWRAYIEEHQMRWPQYLDRDRKMAGAFHARGVPNFFLIDQNGAIVYHQRGWDDSSAEHLEQLIDQTMAGPGQAKTRSRHHAWIADGFHETDLLQAHLLNTGNP